MPKKRKLLSVNDKCRICLGDDGCMGDIFAEELRPKINDLAECTSIHINDDDNFPRNICHVCLYKLDMWIDFKKQFVRSNIMLREHLELSELSDNAASTTKRKFSEMQDCAKDEPNDHGSEEKKMKSEVPFSSNESQVIPECETTETKPFIANTESIAKEESSQNKPPGAVAVDEAKEVSENTSDAEAPAASLSPKTKQIIGRRAKANERRKASTKRWVARKKALLAATGENDTDTDSISSDDPQLSPVQKARAKCNAEKVAETNRRITKALQSNLDSNISGYYGTNADSDSCVIGENDSENKLMKNDAEKSCETPANGSSQNRLSANHNVDEKAAKNLLSSVTTKDEKKNPNVNDFLPNSVRSELVVDDATFVVTSTLILSDPHCPNVAQPNDSTNAQPSEDNRERNTDIIDAVQLRRVSPKTNEKRDKKFVESCLNIEVEGTELEALQRVQKDLANFVENDMRNKFSRDGLCDIIKAEKTKESFPTLDRQLRTIVEKAIEKNLEHTRNIANNRGDKTFTSEFVRAALKSKIFQPRVLLLRLDVERMRESEKKSAILTAKNSKIIEKNSVKEIVPVTRGKRRCGQPKKFADYDTSPGISELDDARDTNIVQEETKIVGSPGPKSSKVKTYGPASAKQILPTVNQREAQRTKNVPQTAKILPMLNNESTIKNLPNNDEASIGEKHICGVCGDSFSTRREVEIHFSTHKNSIPIITKQTKQKMMRCKRCHEIVEARNVKLHVCRTLRSIYKCYSCNSSFKTEKMLTRHLASHSFDDRDGKIDLVPRKETKSKIKTERFVDETETDGPINEENNSQLQQVVAGATRESYTCFVCDKTFTDEEILKDHLQQHCDDMSDDQRSNGKDYQCAICGESLDSEDALETHVEKHLFDDEDDNPNLISIGANNEDEKIEKITSDDSVRCGQCAEVFDSEMLLMLHMQAHDEEVAIAEWERRGIDGSQHICVICDDVFATEIELSDHLEIHNGNAHICQLCDKPFLTLEELQCHVNTH